MGPYKSWSDPAYTHLRASALISIATLCCRPDRGSVRIQGSSGDRQLRPSLISTCCDIRSPQPIIHTSSFCASRHRGLSMETTCMTITRYRPPSRPRHDAQLPMPRPLAGLPITLSLVVTSIMGRGAESVS